MAEQANLASALALVQAELPQISKTQVAFVKSDKANYSYNYADLADISRVILPLLGKHGLAWMTKPTVNADGKFVLAYKLLHGGSGEAEEGEYPLQLGGSPQQVGSAITYARRYALCSMTGVAPDREDDDGAAAANVRPPRDERVELVNSIAHAANAAGIELEAVVAAWEQDHDGEHIKDATDMDALWKLLEAIRRGEWKP